MKAEKTKELKKTVATLFETINTKNREQGINAQYKYNIVIGHDEERDIELRNVEIIMSELGYKDTVLQEFRFQKPKSLDKFTMEYKVFMNILASMIETTLITWTQLGKSLNLDSRFQKDAINSLKDDKKTDRNTDK